MNCRPISTPRRFSPLGCATSLALACVLPLFLCQCGDGKRGDSVERDPIAAVKRANPPSIDPSTLDLAEGIIPTAKVWVEAAKDKTWEELFEGMAGSDITWKTKAVDADAMEIGVLATAVVDGSAGSVLFSVSEDGTEVLPIQFIEGDEILSRDTAEIAFMVIGGWGGIDRRRRKRRRRRRGRQKWRDRHEESHPAESLRPSRASLGYRRRWRLPEHLRRSSGGCVRW